jgi:hypothetical protein
MVTDARLFSGTKLQSVLVFVTIPSPDVVCTPNAVCVFVHFSAENCLVLGEATASTLCSLRSCKIKYASYLPVTIL